MSLDFDLEAAVVQNVYSGNITHNLVPMWKEAGVYDALYHSYGQTAGSLVPVLQLGLTRMTNDPDTYRAMNDKNGWGTYEDAIRFLTEVERVCRCHPDAVVKISA